MGWIDDHVTQGYYTWQQKVISVFHPGSTTEGYYGPEDGEQDGGAEYETYSYVVYGTPLRETKCLFVPEMPDFFTDAQLNTTYHSKQEYEDAVTKYGLIYKSQKFSNADTTQKLLEYATDWIKNNYHGGITSFNVTALDLHMLDSDFRKFTVGQRVNVVYMDPALKRETTQTLTVISAEYDLNNPENNAYKIGIPDVTLNKVYGETSKSGSGGGGGDKPSDQTDDETNKNVDGLIDEVDALTSFRMEDYWAMMYKGAKNGEDFSLGDLVTPNDADPTSDFIYGLKSDIMKSSLFQGAEGVIKDMENQWLTVTEGLDANAASIDNIHTVETVNDGTTKTKDLEATNGISTKDIDATGTASVNALKIDGLNFKPSVLNGKLRFTIGGTTYTVTPD